MSLISGLLPVPESRNRKLNKRMVADGLAGRVIDFWGTFSRIDEAWWSKTSCIWIRTSLIILLGKFKTNLWLGKFKTNLAGRWGTDYMYSWNWVRGFVTNRGITRLVLQAEQARVWWGHIWGLQGYTLMQGVRLVGQSDTVMISTQEWEMLQSHRF